VSSVSIDSVVSKLANAKMQTNKLTSNGQIDGVEHRIALPLDVERLRGDQFAVHHVSGSTPQSLVDARRPFDRLV
jgi:hypothetical protein